ncbi:MAG: hypothetical protein K2K64_11235 [Muribaculaceae bacterium]|nr:hypothetical protein [Muribaculaceae bacterium]MDE7108968.1 hypothetical protein [Muribaculaceae bacterium]
MLAIGIILFLVGFTFRILLNLTARYERDMLTPRRMSERMAALNLITEKRRILLTDANIIMVTGVVICLVTGLFN